MQKFWDTIQRNGILKLIWPRKMLEERTQGLFVVFEGIDGSGEDTQLDILYKTIKSWDKYQNILATHEPTKSREEIKKKLEKETDPYSNAEEMTELYIEDRREHTYELLMPNIRAGVIVLCSRYKMSTCAYQQAQGIPLDKLLKMQSDRGIIKPDLTFFLDVSGDVAEERRRGRNAPREKFELREFMDKASANYQGLYELSRKNPKLFGRVIKIDGNPKIEVVAKSIEGFFSQFYREWKGIDYYWGDHHLQRLAEEQKSASSD